MSNNSHQQSDAFPGRNFYTIEDLMAFFHLERETVIKHFVKEGDIPYRKRGSVYAFHKEHFDAWLKGDDRPNATA